MSMNILIADDDPSIRELLKLYLTQERYQVYEAQDGIEASEVLENEMIHLALVDVMMPHKNGFELCEEIRQHYDIPIILLTAKGESEDKAKGFLSGTDDYVVKPFEMEELMFRIRALLRRYQLVSSKVIRFKEMEINQNSLEVTINGEILYLPLKEFELLVQLASFPNRTFTRDQLIHYVWGDDFDGDMRTVDVHIKRLREKIHPRTDTIKIVTIRGLGYKLEVEKS